MLRIAGLVKYAVLGGMALAFLAAAQAQEAKEDKTVVIVNGHEIKVSEIQMAKDDISSMLVDLPPKLRYPSLVNYLVERHLMAQAAVKEGVADTDEYKRRLALYQAKALRDAYYFQKVLPDITEAEIKLAYDQEAAKVTQTERIRARHILVGTEKEAQDLLERLSKGEKFDDLAKQYSLDGSKEAGGDLGYFTAAEMVPEFSKAAFALKTGALSTPVKTDFGWHIIRLEERKMGAAQPYDQVKSAIKGVLMRKKGMALAEKLRLAAKVEVLDEDLKKFYDQAAQQAKAAGEKQMEQAPAAVEGDATDTGGKGDLLIPAQ